MIKNWLQTAVLVVFAALIGIAGDASAQSTNKFTNAGVSGWNVKSNWEFNVVPGDNFPTEIAGINNGGTAILDAPAQFSIQGFILGEGAGESGTLSLSTGSDLLLSGNGQVGLLGSGILNFGGGDLNIGGNLTADGLASSEINLSGSAALGIGGSANFRRITRITGPDVNIEVGGSVNIDGTFIPVITGASHSSINSLNGTVSLGGVLRPEFVNFTPSLGDSWVLAAGDSISGQFDSIDLSAAGNLPDGAALDIQIGTNAENQQVAFLTLDTKLVLTVNRVTSATEIRNPIGSVEIDGYSIGSASAALNPADGAWQSLHDSGVDANGWDEANPTANLLTELNPNGTSTLNQGDSFNLGTAYSPGTPTAFGQLPTEDLTFEYRVAGTGAIAEGIIEYEGNRNTIVLSVDPNTGEAEIQNQSTFSVDIDSYSIRSASGSLVPGDAGWSSLQDQNNTDWLEAAPTATLLAELNPDGVMTVGGGSGLNIGSPFQVGGSKDLSIRFSMSDGTVVTGFVEYAAMGPPTGLVGDLDNSGVVDAADFRLLASNYGGNGVGDLDNDGKVGVADLKLLQGNFGATVAASPQSVPEPATWILGLLGLCGLAMFRRRSADR